ncbi:hypothetical protein WJX84_004155 [Apatococcus fuscideae]|uniref:Uncharacterized protein n=1 Tax=Apatococcus fuscideae TaxID=2026836 RepID=A0AAW1T5V4_9CHLO
MLDDVPGTCVGGWRQLEVGDMVLVQQLDAVDDEEHRLKYHAVDHPSNRWDPPGSFVNDGWTISMKPVSLGNSTHILMTGKFMTEPEHVAAMSTFIQEMCDSVITGVTRYLGNAAAAGLLAPRKPDQGMQQHAAHPSAHYDMPYPMSHTPTGVNQAAAGMTHSGMPSNGQPTHHTAEYMARHLDNTSPQMGMPAYGHAQAHQQQMPQPQMHSLPFQQMGHYFQMGGHETLARLCNDSHWIRLVAVNHIYKLSAFFKLAAPVADIASSITDNGIDLLMTNSILPACGVASKHVGIRLNGDS